MKTKELIKYFEDEGYETMFDDYFDKGVLFIDKNYGTLLCVLKGDRIDTDYCAFNNLDYLKKQEYYKVIFDYLMTPIEEREEEKKYYLKQIGIGNNHSFLNYDSSIRGYSTYDKREFGTYQTQFTQSEIDNLPECYKHPAVWEKVEVEREE